MTNMVDYHSNQESIIEPKSVSCGWKPYVNVPQVHAADTKHAVRPARKLATGSGNIV